MRSAVPRWGPPLGAHLCWGAWQEPLRVRVSPTGCGRNHFECVSESGPGASRTPESLANLQVVGTPRASRRSDDPPGARTRLSFCQHFSHSHALDWVFATRPCRLAQGGRGRQEVGIRCFGLLPDRLFSSTEPYWPFWVIVPVWRSVVQREQPEKGTVALTMSKPRPRGSGLGPLHPRCPKHLLCKGEHRGRACLKEKFFEEHCRRRGGVGRCGSCVPCGFCRRAVCRGGPCRRRR